MKDSQRKAIFAKKKKFIVSGVEKDGSGDTGNNILLAKSKKDAIQRTKKQFPTLGKLKVRSA
jgi:hypothetical protein